MRPPPINRGRNPALSAGIETTTTRVPWVLLFVVYSFTTLARGTDRPNFLVLVWEDVSPHFGCYGDPLARTPTIDRLAADGIRYDKAFAVSGVCAPSRSAIITARWPVSLGSHQMRSTVKLPPDLRCFPAYLRDAGYYCINPGQKTDYNFDAPGDTWHSSAKEASWNKRAPGQPFLAVHNFVQTHQGPAQTQSTADRQRAKLPPGAAVTPDRVNVPGYFPDTPGVRQGLANVLNNIAYTDGLTADLLRQLENDGLADDTIIIFFGDHGDGIPRIKTHLYHESLRVPLVVRIPARFRKPGLPAAGSAVDELVSLMDIGPTILSLAGVPPPTRWDGRAILGEHRQAPPPYLFGARDRIDFSWNFQRAVLDGRWHYIRDFRPDLWPRPPSHSFRISAILQESRKLHGGGTFSGPGAAWLEKTGIPEELYDTQADPHCLRNLAADPAQAGRLATMRAALHGWQVRVKDLGFLPESIMVRAAETAGDPASIPAATLAALPELALAWERGESARPGLLASLGAANSAERHWAALGLGQLLPERATVAALRGRLADSSPAVVLAAVWSLHRLGNTDPATTTALRKVLVSSHPIELMEAIQIAHHMGRAASSARPELQRLAAMKTPPPYARQIAFAAGFALESIH